MVTIIKSYFLLYQSEENPIRREKIEEKICNILNKMLQNNTEETLDNPEIEEIYRLFKNKL